jgi:hypothetical protein
MSRPKTEYRELMLTCPICGIERHNLSSHFAKVHKIDRIALKEQYGMEQVVSEYSKQKQVLSVKKTFENPDLRKRISDSVKKAFDTRGTRKQLSLIITKKWNDPLYRNKLKEAQNSKETKKLRKDSCTKAAIEKWKDIEYRSKLSKKLSSKSVNKKKSKAMVDKWKDIDWATKNLISSQNIPRKNYYMTGLFESQKNQSKISFQSSYELKCFLMLEQDRKVSKFGRCDFFIHYFFEGKLRRYTPDVFVEYSDGQKEILEVKPSKFVDDLQVTVKFLSLESYCRENNFKCRFITEQDLGV